MARLSEEYKKNIKDKMMETFKYKNAYQIPKISKMSWGSGLPANK